MKNGKSGSLILSSIITTRLLTLLNDKYLDSEVRRSIAEAIGQLGEPSVLPQLLTLLSDQNLHVFLQISITRAIGQLGEPSVLPQLLTLLNDKRLGNDVQRSIAWAIGQLGEPSVLPQLLTLLNDEHLDSELQKDIARVTVNLAQSLESLEQTSLLLQQWDIFAELHKASQRLGARLYWAYKKEKLITVEQCPKL